MPETFLTPDPVSPYLQSPLRTLYEVCRKLRRDRDGKACPTCTLRDICEANRRALAELSAPGFPQPSARQVV